MKAEAAKFDMERDEFMNVEGEAEFDVDIMKELRCVSYRTRTELCCAGLCWAVLCWAGLGCTVLGWAVRRRIVSDALDVDLDRYLDVDPHRLV